MVVRHHCVFRESLGREKNACQPIIVLYGNRVEFMIMATGAPQGHPHEGTSGGIQLLIDNIPPHLIRVVAGQHLWTHREKPESSDLLTPLLQ